MVGEPYTLITWNVRAGREEDFVSAWEDVTRWVARQAPDVEWPRLLRDPREFSRFVSFGALVDPVSVERWRTRPEWGRQVTRLLELVESFDARRLEAARRTVPSADIHELFARTPQRTRPARTASA